MSDTFERGYQAGYRAALGAAAAKCREQAEVEDRGENIHSRYVLMTLASAVLSLRVPAIAVEPDKVNGASP